MAGAVEEGQIALAGTVELHDAVHVIALLELDPHIRAHAVPKGVLEAKLRVVLAGRGVNEVSAELAYVLRRVAAVPQAVRREAAH